VDEEQSAGLKDVLWNAQNTSGAASGIYFAHLEVAGRHSWIKMTLMK
jgi:hypothetical protein